MKLISGFLLLSINLVLAQDYQDYEQPQRAAPVRLRPGNGPVEARPTPVAILKQINRHNEDGSYTYGYEGGDGSFKIETKLATGEVKGKYGYVDSAGKVRVVEYGANKYGFQPSGEGITVAPPTLVDETTNKDGLQLDYEEEQQQQQYQQQPQKPFIARVARPQPRPAPRPQPRPQYVDYEQEPEQQPAPRQQYSAGPAPPRLQIPGAQPTDVVYSPQSRPARPESEYSQIQSFGFGPQQQQQSNNVRLSRPLFSPPPSGRAETFPAQVRPVQEQSYQPQQQQQQQQHQQQQQQPRPQYVPHASPSAPQGRSTSVLDQLAKDYALPQNGANPLHDISFGYF